MRGGVFGRRRKGAHGWRAMELPRAPLWLVWAGLGSFVPGSRCGSSRHFLSYSYLEVSESSQRLPQFLSLVHLDDEPIARYDIPTRKLVPLVPWMEVEEAQMFVVPDRVFRADLQWLSELNPHSGGLHTWQVNLGCELREDGNKGGFFCYGYDGRDCISFNKETLRWVEAQPQAQKIKEKLEKDPARSERNKFFLENNCLEWLQKCLSYQKEAPKKTEPPVGKVTLKVVNDSLEVLTCHAFGFYPKEIRTTWRRDGEICHNETLHRSVAPNSDGTYYVQLSIDIDPKERNRFRCHLEHEGLKEPLVLAWKEETVTEWQIPVGTVAAIILGVVIAIFLIYMCWKKCHPKVTTCCDPDSQDNQPSPSVELHLMSPPNVSSEQNATDGGQRPQMAPPEDNAQRLLSGGGQLMVRMLRILTIIVINLIVTVILFMITFAFTIISHISQVTQNLKQNLPWLIQNWAGQCMYWYLQLRGGIQNFLLTVLWEGLGGRGLERILQNPYSLPPLKISATSSPEPVGTG